MMGMMLSARYVPRDDPAKRTESHALDAVGLLLLSPGLTMLLLALSNIVRDARIAVVGVILPSAIGLLFLGFFCLWALHGTTHPIVDIRLFRFRSLTGSCIVLVVSGAIMYAAMFLLPLYYQDLRGMSVLAAGLLMIPQGLGTLLSRFAAGRLSDTLGARGFTAASLLLAAAATIPFAYATATTDIWWLGIVLFARGMGIGALLIPAMTVAYRDVPTASVHDATMSTRITQQIGASLGTATVAVVLQGSLDGGAVHAFHMAFWCTVVMSLAGLLPSWMLPGRRDAVPPQSIVSYPRMTERVPTGSCVVMRRDALAARAAHSAGASGRVPS